MASEKTSTSGGSSSSEEKKGISASDMTRRMVCGGSAGMVAKVSL